MACAVVRWRSQPPLLVAGLVFLAQLQPGVATSQPPALVAGLVFLAQLQPGVSTLGVATATERQLQDDDAIPGAENPEWEIARQKAYGVKTRNQDHIQQGCTVHCTTPGEEDMSILRAVSLMFGTFLLATGLLVWYLRWKSRWSRKVRRSRRKITAEEIERRFPSGVTEGEPTCVICLSVVEAEQVSRTTQCGHAFHADCLEAWWLHKSRKSLHCPICRQKQQKDCLPGASPPPVASPSSAEVPGQVLGAPCEDCLPAEQDFPALPHAPMVSPSFLLAGRREPLAAFPGAAAPCGAAEERDVELGAAEEEEAPRLRLEDLESAAV